MTQKNKQKTNNDQDILGAYPERTQVSAFPERRYIKTNRFLTVLTVINLSLLMAGAGVFTYMARRVDVRVTAPGRIMLYSINPEEKVLVPAEFYQAPVSALQLVMEDTLRKYIKTRHSVVWEMETMAKNWGPNGPLAWFSDPAIMKAFQPESAQATKETRSKNRVRETFIYDIHPVHDDLWVAFIETIDFPINEDLETPCSCMTDDRECLKCKWKNGVNRQRRKIWIRANFDGVKTLNNPMGVQIYAYNIGYIPIHPEETFWNLPPMLRPEI